MNALGDRRHALDGKAAGRIAQRQDEIGILAVDGAVVDEAVAGGALGQRAKPAFGQRGCQCSPRAGRQGGVAIVRRQPEIGAVPLDRVQRFECEIGGEQVRHLARRWILVGPLGQRLGGLLSRFKVGITAHRYLMGVDVAPASGALHKLLAHLRERRRRPPQRRWPQFACRHVVSR